MKPVEDSWGHQWHASLYNTLVYALATNRQDYIQSEPFKQAADRALIAHDAGGGPFGYLSAFDGATGRRLWACYTGEPAAFLAPFGKQNILGVCASGMVFQIDSGRLVGHDDVGSSITAVLRPGDHRNRNAML